LERKGKNMDRMLRMITVAVAVFGILFFAWDQAAWARPATAANRSFSIQNNQSVPPDRDDCKDKEEDKEEKKCKEKEHGGTVKPPPSIVEIPVTGGGYSVGGVCIIEIEYYISSLLDKVHLEVPDEISRSIPFPPKEGKIHLPGCHVLHYKSNQLVDQMSAEEGRWTICFAAHPKKTMTIYYYLDNLESVTPPWMPLETTVVNQRACAPANYTGVYAPASK
jgi:hypothetical protein